LRILTSWPSLGINSPFFFPPVRRIDSVVYLPALGSTTLDKIRHQLRYELFKRTELAARLVPTNPFNPTEVVAALNNRYMLGPELRVGGQGVVYRASRIRDGNGNTCADDVALKLHLDSRQDERVEREISAAKNLRHPTLATLLEDGTIVINGKSTRYIAWDFIAGEPLDTRLSRGALDEAATIQIAADVTSAIAALWSRHIVHRDVTPKNIIVKADGRAVLIDLGGARHLEHTTITAPGATFGTVGYFSPEQYRAEHALTSASDVFTLGVVLLECLLGHHPTHFDQNQLAASQSSAHVLVPTVHKELREVIDGMLKLRAPFRPSLARLQEKFDQLLKTR
jgi:serine/threonine protein kinase